MPDKPSYEALEKRVRDLERAEAEYRRTTLSPAHSHDLMRYIIEHTRSAVAVHDRDLRYIYVSRRYLEEYGVKETDIIGRHHYEVFPDLPEKWRAVHRRALAGETSAADRDPYVREDGTQEWTCWECRPWYEADGGIGGIIVYTEVITDRIKAEEQQQELQFRLAQAQKMESIGRLAGGVAHDFNNMLTVILGYARSALDEIEPSSPIYPYLQEIFQAGTRSADITRQLLAFARRQAIAPRVLDMNQTVEEMLNMLGRLMGEDVRLIWRPSARAGSVKMDPSQLDQILANLCVNARDAIQGVGQITIETDVQTFDEAYCALHPGYLSGEFVMLAVSDDGCGMDRDTLKNLFEPFYTTKPAGKGTGLGLSTVYGIVTQNRGFINVYSEPGRGSTFRIYLPREFSSEDRPASEKPGEVIPRGHETILLVEDEPAILEMTRMMLNRQGYHVLAAATPTEALELAEGYAEDIHLVLTDVVMPEMNGRDLADRMTELYPGMKRLFMSGYTTNVIVHQGVLDDGIVFVQKPFSMAELAAKVRTALGGK